MDLVHQSQEPTTQIKTCLQHKRLQQCYCQNCNILICPSCLMFGSHKGHNVCQVQKGARQLRSRINTAARQSLLKFDRTQTLLLDIRHSKLNIQQTYTKKTTQIETQFDQLINLLKHRKKTVLGQLSQKFDTQLQKLQKIQTDWLQKQQICQKLLSLQSSNDDLKLLQQGQYVVQGLQRLSQPLNWVQISILQEINMVSLITPNSKSILNNNQIKSILNTFVQFKQPTVNRVKC